MAIVCGVDFSSWSQAAAEVAAALAERRQELLFLVHALEPNVERMEGEALARVQTMLTERLGGEASRLKALTKAPIETAVLQGPADEAVRHFAATRKASLVVVGSAGHGAGALVKLGGASERLASGAEVPVLVVRDAEAMTAWAKGAGLRVMVGFDDGEAAMSALRWVEGLRQLAPVDVVLGRVYYQDEAHRQYGLSKRFSYTDADPRVEALIERDLKAHVPRLEGRGELFYRAKLAVGRVADHLLELAEAERCQLVVVGSHGRRGLARMWSVSAAALHLSRMAVVVVPPDGKPARVTQPRVKRVLVTTDFSSLGNAAVPWAYALAEPGGEVYLAHVTLTTGLAGELVEQYLPSADLLPQAPAKVELEVAARLRALTPGVADEKHLVTRTEVVRGANAAQAISDAAERVAADVIVISSHGRSGLAKTLFGSVAEAVLKASRKPVFIVRA
ncbi:MAG: universal stress protein [Myxococcaceae bacterium]|jgi:nucleotide-binding universal stress UspA family protein|nr:universal stress protein [Myxococcaceae bacterium]